MPSFPLPHTVSGCLAALETIEECADAQDALETAGSASAAYVECLVSMAQQHLAYAPREILKDARRLFLAGLAERRSRPAPREIVGRFRDIRSPETPQRPASTPLDGGSATAWTD